MIAVGLLTMPASAATLYNSRGRVFSSGEFSNTTLSKIAYVVYSETTGVPTIADDTVVATRGVSRGLIDLYIQRRQDNQSLSGDGMAGRDEFPYPEQGRADGATLKIL
mgnify:CR=1 FL=1